MTQEDNTSEYVPLPGEGEELTIRKVRARRECQECGEPATRRLTYLLKNARSNPQSSAYRHDDCSWCSDAEAFACTKHGDKVWRDCPEGMDQCSMFFAERMPHMVLYWKEVKPA